MSDFLVLTHAHDISSDGVAEREVAGDGDKDVDETSDAYTCNDNAGCPEVGIIADLVDDGKHLSSELACSSAGWGVSRTYVLVTGVCKHNYGKATERRYGTFPPDQPDDPSILHGIPFDEMCNNKNDQVANGYQGDDACVFEGVQAP